MKLIRTLTDLLRARAESHPSRGYQFLGDGVSVSETMTYADLDVDARRIAVALQASGARSGDRALLLFQPGLDFARAFWACFYAGIIAVPVPPPQPGKLRRTGPRLTAITTDCRADIVLTSSKVMESARSILETLKVLGEGQKSLIIDSPAVAAIGPDDGWVEPASSPDDIALLQYTSGSTREPRGVMVSHANLLHNLSMLRKFHREQEHMVMVSWLPLYHDMGLIRGMMSPLHMGGDCVMMPPLRFVERPLKWLAAITNHRGTTTGSPDFGYALTTRKAKDADEETLAKIDLSSLVVAFSTAEPIRKSTVDGFLEAFAPSGLRRSAFRPAYGLSEATVAIAGELGINGVKSWRVSKSALRDGRAVVCAASTREESQDLVSCGSPLGDDQEVVIVDDHGQRSAEDRVGEIWVRGPSVARGYWEKESDTREAFDARLADGTGPFLRTGDLGWRAPDGGLCVVGRRKDLIIVRGQNYHPQDIEATVEESSSDLRAGCSAAFVVELEGAEHIIVVCEATVVTTTERSLEQWEALVTAIRSAVSEDHELALHGVFVLRSGWIPKTASGKVQRTLARQMYLDGSFQPLSLHSWILPR